MKALCDFFRPRNILFKRVTPLSVHELGSRKKIDLFESVDQNSNVWAIFIVKQKSRFLSKHALELDTLFDELRHFRGREYRYKICLVGAPICSKAYTALQKRGWRIENGTM